MPAQNNTSRTLQHWAAIIGIVLSFATAFGGACLFVISHSITVGQALETNHASIEGLRSQQTQLAGEISESRSRIENLEHATSDTSTDLAVLKAKMSNIESKIGDINVGIQHLQDMLATRHFH